jgi:3-oxoadipate enol-lactonase
VIVTAHDGVRLVADVHGPDSAPTVVLIHGATLDRRSWDPTVAALEGYRIVVPDVRGHGESLLDKPFRYEDAVRDVGAFLTDSPTVLVGLSMGGILVQSVLERCPPQVRGAVLVGCSRNTAPRGRTHPLQAAMTAPAIKAYPRRLFYRQVAARTAVRPDVRAYVLEVSSRIPRSRVAEIMDALIRGSIHPDPSWRVPVPTLLLLGTEDKLAKVRFELPAWAEVDPGCTFAQVPQAGHASNQDNPETFNALLLDHLQRVLPLSSPATGGAAR